MATDGKSHRLLALAERSSYIENILRHALVASLSCEVWSRDPALSLQVFNSEVDDSGFDIVLTYQSRIRYVQLKQSHDAKLPPYCSISLSFSRMPGSCVVLMSHALSTLQLTSFRFFGGVTTSDAMPAIGELRASKSPGRRSATGERKVRANYRDIPVRQFTGLLSAAELLDALFPPAYAG
jgi:hypothetical protein